MKKLLKGIKNAIEHIILPRKAQNLAGMSMLFSLLIFLACFFLSMSSSNWTVEGYVEDSIGDRYFLLTEDKTFTVESGDTVLPTLEYKKDYSGNYLYAKIKSLPVENKYVYDTTIVDNNGKKSNVKFVYELDYLEEQASENEEERISKTFVGNYSFKVNSEDAVLQIAKTGVGYYNGNKLEFVKVENEDMIKATSDDFNIEVSFDGAKHTIKVNGTVVNSYVKEESSATFKHFDIDKYYHEKESYDENENDILIIYTRNIVYYLFNRGYTSDLLKDTEIHSNFITMPKEDGSFENDVFDYYLPGNTLEITDPTSWNVSANKGDTFKVNGEDYIDSNGNKVYAYNKLTSSMSRLFKYNVPLISYNYCETSNVYQNIYGTDPIKALEDYSMFHVVSWGDSINYQTSCQQGLPFGFMIPLICVVFTWIISRRRGNLKLFKEYFNIAAISYIPVALVEFILGFFLQYSIFIYFLIVLQLGVFIFYVYRINTNKEATETIVNNSTNETLKVEETVEVIEVPASEDEESPNKIG